MGREGRERLSAAAPVVWEAWAGAAPERAWEVAAAVAAAVPPYSAREGALVDMYRGLALGSAPVADLTDGAVLFL